MQVSLVVAMDRRGGIGLRGGMPWHLGDDLRHFRRLTMGHHVLMGRVTYEATAGKLPGRKLIVLSRDAGFQPPDAQVAGSLAAGLRLAEAAGEDELFVIGGGQVFAAALPLASRLYLTRVHAEVEADTFFPDFDESEWRLVSQRDYTAGERNDFDFSVMVLER
ncbi:MAG: dihydrofolate reductase [Anaerolineales bacterium]|nr:dihydrofolate reductase [Anaerolineales bacterium]